MLPVLYFLLDLAWMRTVNNTEAKMHFFQGTFRSSGNLRSVTTLYNSYVEMVQGSSRFLKSTVLRVTTQGELSATVLAMRTKKKKT